MSKDIEDCAVLVEQLMKAKLIKLRKNNISTKGWRFSLVEDHDDSAFLHLDRAPNHEAVVRVLKFLLGVTVTEEPIKFVAECELGGCLYTVASFNSNSNHKL